jgi:hypothetical protein
MGVPAEYMEIREYIAGYISMQKILAKFENKDPYKVRGSLTEDENNWVIVISDKCLYTNRYYDQIYTYSIYMNKHNSEVSLKCKVKSAFSCGADNYLLDELFRKLASEKIRNVKLIPQKSRTYSVTLDIKLTNEIPYVEQVNSTLNIITKYNDIVFDKLCDKWIRMTQEVKPRYAREDF